MVGSIQGAYIPSALSETIAGQTTTSESLKQQTAQKLTGEAVAVSISQNSQLMAQLKGETLPPTAVENAHNLLQDSNKNKKSDGSAKSRLKSSYSPKKNSTGTQTGEDELTGELKARDAEVRAHEQSHLAAAGSYATGGINYEYQAGPDGKQYAVGGSVDIDTSPVEGDPEATIRKAQIVRSAAYAVSDASSADGSVAAIASSMEMNARMQIVEENSGKKSTSTANKSSLMSYYKDLSLHVSTGYMINISA